MEFSLRPGKSWNNLFGIFCGLSCIVHCTLAQFYIPNPMHQHDLFQAAGSQRFVDTVGLPQQSPSQQPDKFVGIDNFGSRFEMPLQQGADPGFQGGNPNRGLHESGTTPLPLHLQPPPDFVCDETFGHYGDHFNCSRFFVCVFGLPVVQECSKGLYYNPQLGLCDWPKNTECPAKGAGFFAIPGTTTESTPRATIPWWLQGEDAPPPPAPTPSRASPPQSTFNIQADTPIIDRSRNHTSSDFLPQPQNAFASFPMGPAFPSHLLPTTRRPWWNPWQPNDTWPARQPVADQAPSAAPTQQSSSGGSGQDFLSFANLPRQPDRASRPQAPSRDRDQPDLNVQLTPNVDGGGRDRELFGGSKQLDTQPARGGQSQQAQDAFPSGATRPDFFGSPFSRPDFGAEPKPASRPASQSPSSKQSRPSPEFIPAQAPARSHQDNIDFLLGFQPRPPSNSQANDNAFQRPNSPSTANDNPPSNQRPPPALPTFPDFGRPPVNQPQPFPFGADAQPPSPNQSNDQTPFSFSLGADRFDTSERRTTTAPKRLQSVPNSNTANDGQNNGPSRFDFNPSDRNTRPNAPQPQQDLVPIFNMPDFGARFPIQQSTGQDDNIQSQQQQQQPQRGSGQFQQPIAPFPGLAPSRQQDRPAVSSADSIPPGFIPNNQQMNQERLNQLANERIQQLTAQRFTNTDQRFSSTDQRFNLGNNFGSNQNRFMSDESMQPPQPPPNMANGGIIRPSDRMNNNGPQPGLNQFDRGRQEMPEFPNLSLRQNPFLPQQAPNFGLQADQAVHIPMTLNQDPVTFTFTTRVPIPNQRDNRQQTTIPFWMQGSNSNPVVPLGVFRTDVQMQRPMQSGIVPQTRVLQNRHPESTTATSHIAETTEHTTTTTTSKLPWWLQDTAPTNQSSNLAPSASSMVASTLPQVGRNPEDYAKYGKTAETCDRKTCKLPECWCGGSEIPGSLPVGETPQMILITFDDAVTNQNYQLYTSIFNENRRNPNGCPIRGTFYVSHEWSEYFLVQNLYSDGHEIGSHSISHTLPGKNFTKNDWADEIAGQREILNRFGNVKVEDVEGMRAPYLQTGGNNQFEMLWEKGFLYDSSMSVAENNPPLWPYTLDHALPHKCWIPPCPTKAAPGLWEVPLVHWEDLLGYRCAMADACHNPGDIDEVYQLLMNNFKRHYETNRAPFGMYYHSAWFIHTYHMDGFKKFLDTVLAIPDVWIVTTSQALQWIQNPTPLSVINQFEPWSCANLNRAPQCTKPNVCPTFFRGGMRYIRTCEACPESYPWIKNTNGAARTQPTSSPLNSV